MQDYVGLVNKDPVKGMQQYLERFVYGPKSWNDFAMIGMDEVLEAARAGEAFMMLKASSHTAAELLTILSARQLQDGQVVFAGVGIPLLAATLAQRLRCPGLTILFEGGVIGAFVEPGKLPPSTNDQLHGAPTWCSAAPTCCCSCSAAMWMSDSWAGADRSIRQSEQLLHRRSGEPGSPAARHRRRQRHRQPRADDRGDEARKAALC